MPNPSIVTQLLETPELLDKSGNVNKEVIDKIILTFSEQAKGMTQYTAKQFAAMATKIMEARASKQGMQVAAGAAATSTKHAGEGWFQLTAGDTWDINGAKKKFNPADPGSQGVLFEDLFFGGGRAGEESYLPDLFQKEPIYNDVMKWLSYVEVKTSSEIATGISVGKISIPGAFIQDLINEKLEKGEWKYKAVVDETLIRALGLLKLIEKLIALLVVKTRIRTTSSAGTKIFKYISAMLYAKLKIEELVKSFKIDKSAGFFKVDTLKVTSKTKIEKNDEHNYTFATARTDLSINIKANLTGEGIKGTKTLYADSYNMFDEGSVKTFFLAMMESEASANSLSINKQLQELRHEYKEIVRRSRPI
jgi:hypothetical protein